MRVIILAGGKGTRLRPFTTSIPKPIVPIGERAILDILISKLTRAGVKEVTLCVNHLGELIRAFCGDGSKWGIAIKYSTEQDPLGTIGPLKMIKNLPKNFLVMNGDLLTDLDFKQFYNYHLKNGALLTLAVYERKLKSDFGIVKIDESKNIVLDFTEKPEQKFTVNMGIYTLKKEVMKYVPKNKPFGIDDLILTLLRRGETIKVYPYHGYWLDIGRPEDYDKANIDIQNPKLRKVIFR